MHFQENKITIFCVDKVEKGDTITSCTGVDVRVVHTHPLQKDRKKLLGLRIPFAKDYTQLLRRHTLQKKIQLL